MAEILTFPRKFHDKRHYRIPLYSDMDIEIVLFCVNAFGETDKRVIIDDLIRMDPIEVIKSIDFALESEYISNTTKAHIECIRRSIEEIPIKFENDIL